MMSSRVDRTDGLVDLMVQAGLRAKLHANCMYAIDLFGDMRRKRALFCIDIISPPDGSSLLIRILLSLSEP